MIRPERKQTFGEQVLERYLRHVLETWIAHGGEPMELLEKWRSEKVPSRILESLWIEFVI